MTVEKRSHAALSRRLADEQAKARAMGGEAGLARHRASGRLPVRERIDLLIDPGSWFEIGALALPELRTERHVPGDAVVTGFALLHGRRVGVVGIDSSVLAGTTAPTSMRKQGRLIDRAQNAGFPLVLLCDADGGRIPDVMGFRFSGLPLDFKTFVKTPSHLPTVPRAAAILGPSYGDSALHASTAHFVVMVEFGAVALSGPSVVQSAINETLDDAALGGPAAATAVGNAHMVVPTEADAMAAIGAFLSYLPSNASLPAPVTVARDPARDPAAIADTVPIDTQVAYDIRDVIDSIVDDGSYFPWANAWGPSLVCALARIEGRAVGIIANQPMMMAGAHDPASLTKQHDFVAMCDTFNIPLVFLHDVPGLLIGTRAEQGGILRAYERLVSRIADASVPKVGVVLRKAYGGGHFAMGGRPTHPDFLFAWPNAEMGFMAPDTGVRTVYRRRLQKVLEDEGQAAHDRLLTELVQEWTLESEPWEGAANLSLDDIIQPADTRRTLARAIDVAWGERGYVSRR
ncbi:acyl-CoA carboxylase subunit beta [Gemmobacter sp.]|uniref:acyl-CoA carboxylase subunit beta n=1 Tax=Gemmobacter sp. TaxID=1898957 RepID=UPI002AFFD31C|nr:carboxyl transferase domain-containing protein [Gemmobacter sp.]